MEIFQPTLSRAIYVHRTAYVKNAHVEFQYSRCDNIQSCWRSPPVRLQLCSDTVNGISAPDPQTNPADTWDQHDGLFKMDMTTQRHTWCRHCQWNPQCPSMVFCCGIQTITQGRESFSLQTRLQLHKLNKHTIKCCLPDNKGKHRVILVFYENLKSKTYTISWQSVVITMESWWTIKDTINYLRRTVSFVQHWLWFLISLLAEALLNRERGHLLGASTRIQFFLLCPL